MEEDITKLDLYEIIGATITSSDSELKKAYRKKALSCHPDKNPDNPQAAQLFLQLSKALEILTDPAAKAAYDKVIHARAQAKLRVRELDAKRKKLKDELEARERAFKNTTSVISDEAKLKAELERLRKEGSRLVEEEKERLRQKVLEELRLGSSNNTYSEEACRVKIKWKVEPDDETNGGYNQENLQRFLSKHGEVSVLVISTAKKGRALVEFKTREGAESAVKYEKGLIANPLTLNGMWQKTKSTPQVQTNSNATFGAFGASRAFGAFGASGGVSLFPSANLYSRTKTNEVPKGLSCSGAPDIFNSPPVQNDADYENAVLSNLRRAEERKRLIEQMQENDET